MHHTTAAFFLTLTFLVILVVAGTIALLKAVGGLLTCLVMAVVGALVGVADALLKVRIARLKERPRNN